MDLSYTLKNCRANINENWYLASTGANVSRKSHPSCLLSPFLKGLLKWLLLHRKLSFFLLFLKF